MLRQSARSAILALAGSVGFAGCAVGPNYERPKLPTPPEYRFVQAPAQAQSLADAPWFQIFDDPALQALIREAIANNLDLRVALAHVEEARARAGIAKSYLYPQVDGSAAYGVRGASTTEENNDTTHQSGVYGFHLSWEIDLFGRLRRGQEGAIALALASEQGRRGVLVFGPVQTIPGGTGTYGGITVGPGGKVIITYMAPELTQGPATIYSNTDADGLGPGGFGPRVTVTATNVGGYDYIPAQSGRSVDSEAGVVWDATGGAFNNRIYLVYADETVNENNDTDILMRTSDDDGASWSAPVRVNDDATTRSQFNPYVALDPTTGTVAVGFHDARNDNGTVGAGGTNTIPNDDAEYWATYTTNGGASFAPNVRLSGGWSNAAAAGASTDYGDYEGQVAQNGKFYAVWADNANCDGTNPNGTAHQFDLVMGTLQLPGIGSTPTATATPTFTPTSTPTAAQTPSISGSVTYGNAIGVPTQRFVSNVTLSGDGSPLVTTATNFPNGSYALTGFGPGSYTVTPSKTAGQNSITSFDAARISQHVTGTSLLTGNQLIVADVSSNGAISSFDAAEIARYAAAVTGFGGTGNWIFSPTNRAYPSVNSNIAGEDYSALLLGEVSGNWTDTGARPESKASDSSGQENIAVTAPQMITPAGDEVLIPVNIVGVANKGIIAYEFDLRYDPAVVQPAENPVEVKGTLSRGLSAVTNANEPSLLRVVVYGAYPIDNDGVLLYLRFKAVGKPGSVSALSFEWLMFNEGNLVTLVTDGQVELSTSVSN